MPLPENLLNPISGPNPSGTNLRYSDLYDQIQEARRYEDELPQGAWEHALKVADYDEVIRLASEALANQTKDLQLAAWLTEALIQTEGFGGLRQGLDVLVGLLDKFWDTLYPEIEDGDLEYRAGPIEWVGTRLEQAIKGVPLTAGGLNWFKYKESRVVGYEKDVAGPANTTKKKARDAAIAEKKVTAEEFDKDLAGTQKDYYERLRGDLEGSLASLKSLDQASQAKFKNSAPSLGKLRSLLEEVKVDVSILLKQKVQQEAPKVAPAATQAAPPPTSPPTVAPAAGTPGAPAAATSPSTPVGASSEAGVAVPTAPAVVAPAPPGAPPSDSGPAAPSRAVPTAPPPTAGVEPANRDDAVKQLVAVARYLRKQQPQNPAAYLILRGLRWGELRAKGEKPDPALLEAPPTETRQQLKRLVQEGKWQEVLEAVETAMALPCGRAWLDLQRYLARACQGLGAAYVPVARALRSELTALLADFPSLWELTFTDDTPVANVETQAWLREEVIGSAAVMPAAKPPAGEIKAPQDMKPQVVDPFELASRAARSGRAQEAIEILMREVAQERSGRARFHRRIQLAQICVATKHESVAYPILVDLAAEIDSRKLDEWEPPEVVAQALVLLFRCVDKLNRNSDEKQRIYARICRIDPVQAMACEANPGASAR
jgi:type VI secretion system protein ImpA